jgi:integral membrane protein
VKLDTLGRFRWAAWLEGGSFLVLLFIAMPLKYWAGEPLAVRIVGMAHGVLFLAYLALLAQVAIEHSWTKARVALAFVASLVPFGPFWFDSRLRAEG